MGMLKPLAAGTTAALMSDDADAGVVYNVLGKQVVEGWHGGLKGIDRFSDKYLGSGEGAHVYTHGHYMADQKRTAKRYRNDRQKEYDAEVSKAFFESDLLTHYRSNPRDYILLEYGDGPPLTMRFDDYEEIVLEAAQMFGKNSDAAQDYINRKVFRKGDERRSWIHSLSEGAYVEEDMAGISGDMIGREYWIEDSVQALAHEMGAKPMDMQRSLQFDLEADLPPDVSWDDLSLTAQSKLMEPVIVERLNLVKGRMAREAKQRRNVQFTGDPNNSNAPGPMAVANGTAPKQPNFEAKVPDEIAKEFGSDLLFDFSKMKENPQPRKAGLYRVHADAKLDELLHWESQLSDHPEAVKMAVSSAAADILDKGVASGRIAPDDLTARVPVYDEDGYGMSGLELLERVAAGNFPPQFSAADFATQFSQSVNPRAFMNGEELSKLLSSKGIKGMMYQDGWTRDKRGVTPHYNYVIYGEDLMKIMERGMANVPTQLLMATGATVGLGAPVLVNKEIAERFPLPSEEDRLNARSGLDKVLDHKGFLTPYVTDALQSNTAKQIYSHPVTQYIGQQVENAEWPERLMSGAVEAIYNASEGVKPRQIGSEFVERIQTPYDETLNELGGHVLKETNSPALATGATMGGMFLSPSNWVGP
jgi:hypothetical protein